MEQQLIREGMPVAEVQRLCDLHVGVFKTGLEEQEVQAPPGHPVHTYVSENLVFAGLVDRLSQLIGQLTEVGALASLKSDLSGVTAQLAHLETHYLRKENQLFPYLEQHGVTGPTKVMWGVHNEIRQMLKSLQEALLTDNGEDVASHASQLARAVSEMIYKENKILFPLALENLSKQEWIQMRKGEEEIGYCFNRPAAEWPPSEETVSEQGGREMADALKLSTGELTLEQIDGLLKYLPVDVSFVDEQDSVRYYSDTPERIFPRSPAVIGRNVENCHPPKSIDKVRQILDAFREGRKDKAEFWIQLDGHFILIRYFAVRDTAGKYLGCLEVSQDITGIRKLEGERRLLDWEG